MKSEDYKLGQKVSLYGRIDAIDIENMRDIENTTTLKINTSTRTISVNPKWEEVKLDQPKPVVPQCVFDLIKKYKNENRSFYAFIENTSDVKEVWEWLNMPKPGIKESELMQAWLAYPNITVEKEKLYTVEIPNPNSGMSYIFLTKRVSGVSIDMIDNVRWKADKRNQLTESEIKQDFEWAFRWAEEVEE